MEWNWSHHALQAKNLPQILLHGGTEDHREQTQRYKGKISKNHPLLLMEIFHRVHPALPPKNPEKHTWFFTPPHFILTETPCHQVRVWPKVIPWAAIWAQVPLIRGGSHYITLAVTREVSIPESKTLMHLFLVKRCSFQLPHNTDLPPYIYNVFLASECVRRHYVIWNTSAVVSLLIAVKAWSDHFKNKQ